MESNFPDLRMGARRIKPGYVTRIIPEGTQLSVVNRDKQPERGDLIVARVSVLGVHNHIEDPHGRRARLFDGDLIAGAYGDRYATDFYEGYVTTDPQAHLLTAGGLVGRVASAHDARGKPTELEVLGLLATLDGRPLSLNDFATPPPPHALPPFGTVAVVGSGMNSGKTTSVVSTIRGLAKAGLTVGAGKVTGSGSGKDRWAYVDAGAAVVTDFLDFGMSSTFGYPLDRLSATMIAIRDYLAGAGADVVVLEIADGILQGETAWLLPRLHGVADAVLFAAVDALSARSGVQILNQHRLPVRAVSGVLSRSPLACREVELDIPIMTTADLAGGAVTSLLPRESVLA